jgi:hypothetical protein
VALPDAAAVEQCTGLPLPEVDPASLTTGKGHIPPGATVRAFSDGTNRVLVAAMADAGSMLQAAPTGIASRPADAAATGRWTQDRVLIQLGPAGLVVVDVELGGRSSGDREQIARALAATVSAAWPAAPNASPG